MSSESVDLSIVILTWNTRDMTTRCVRSVLAELETCRLSREIIVVDNASEDGTVEHLRSTFGDAIRLIENDENLLYAEGNNVGARAAKGEFLCILNSDTEVEPGALDDLVQHLESNKDWAVVAPQLFDSEGAQASCSKQWTLVDALVTQSFLRRYSRTLSGRADYIPEGNEPTVVDHVMGACWVMRLSEFLAYGGFCPDLALFFNDHDLCRRLRKRGRKIVYVPQCRIRHLRGQSTRLLKPGGHFYDGNYLTYFRRAYGGLGFAAIYGLILFRWGLGVLRSVLSPKRLDAKRQAFADHRKYWAKVLKLRPQTTQV